MEIDRSFLIIYHIQVPGTKNTASPDVHQMAEVWWSVTLESGVYMYRHSAPSLRFPLCTGFSSLFFQSPIHSSFSGIEPHKYIASKVQRSSCIMYQADRLMRLPQPYDHWRRFRSVFFGSSAPTLSPSYHWIFPTTPSCPRTHFLVTGITAHDY